MRWLLCSLVMMVSQSSLLFACSTVSSYGLQLHLWQRPSSLWQWIDWWCFLVMLYFLIVDLRSQFTQHLIYDAAPDLSGKRVLALTERNRYPSFRSQLCGLYGALWAMLPTLVLPSPCRHIKHSLMRSHIMTWVAKLAKYITIYIYISKSDKI